MLQKCFHLEDPPLEASGPLPHDKSWRSTKNKANNNSKPSLIFFWLSWNLPPHFPKEKKILVMPGWHHTQKETNLRHKITRVSYCATSGYWYTQSLGHTFIFQNYGCSNQIPWLYEADFNTS